MQELLDRVNSAVHESILERRFFDRQKQLTRSALLAAGVCVCGWVGGWGGGGGGGGPPPPGGGGWGGGVGWVGVHACAYARARACVCVCVCVCVLLSLPYQVEEQETWQINASFSPLRSLRFAHSGILAQEIIKDGLHVLLEGEDPAALYEYDLSRTQRTEIRNKDGEVMMCKTYPYQGVLVLCVCV